MPIIGIFYERVLSILYLTFGDIQRQEYDDHAFASVLFLVYVLIFMVTLVNSLIAMMTETFTEGIGQQSIEIWLLEKARIMMAIQNEMSDDDKNADKNKYWEVETKKTKNSQEGWSVTVERQARFMIAHKIHADWNQEVN
jgi:hypothetical protein